MIKLIINELKEVFTYKKSEKKSLEELKNASDSLNKIKNIIFLSITILLVFSLIFESYIQVVKSNSMFFFILSIIGISIYITFFRNIAIKKGLSELKIFSLKFSFIIIPLFFIFIFNLIIIIQEFIT
jgi:hypothetical protein